MLLTFYDCIVNRYGPLVHHWTMRYEAKHRYFKQMASIMGNFTNICYSLSLRHQLYQCYVNLATDDLPEEKLEVGQSMYRSCLKYYLIIIYSWKYFLEFYFVICSSL